MSSKPTKFYAVIEVLESTYTESRFQVTSARNIQNYTSQWNTGTWPSTVNWYGPDRDDDIQCKIHKIDVEEECNIYLASLLSQAEEPVEISVNSDIMPLLQMFKEQLEQLQQQHDQLSIIVKDQDYQIRQLRNLMNPSTSTENDELIAIGDGDTREHYRLQWLSEGILVGFTAPGFLHFAHKVFPLKNGSSFNSGKSWKELDEDVRKNLETMEIEFVKHGLKPGASRQEITDKKKVLHKQFVDLLNSTKRKTLKELAEQAAASALEQTVRDNPLGTGGRNRPKERLKLPIQSSTPAVKRTTKTVEQLGPRKQVKKAQEMFLAMDPSHSVEANGSGNLIDEGSLSSISNGSATVSEE